VGEWKVRLGSGSVQIIHGLGNCGCGSVWMAQGCIGGGIWDPVLKEVERGESQEFRG